MSNPPEEFEIKNKVAELANLFLRYNVAGVVYKLSFELLIAEDTSAYYFYDWSRSGLTHVGE